jgi:hypothetical protein
MSDGLDIPGEVLGAAVVAKAISEGGDAGTHAAAGHHGSCANCGTALNGRFCTQCGQPAHVHRSLLHMVEELLHGIFHFETKSWRTLPLLMFRPGRLTREYIDGKRVRYVAPLPLFLFMMFAMFFTFSLTGHSGEKSSTGKVVEVNAKGEAQAREAEDELKKLRAELAALPASDARRDEDEARITALETKITALTLVPSLVKGDDKDEDAGGDKKPPLTEERLHGQFLENGMTWLATPTIERKIVHAMHNKELAIYKIKNGAAKFAILLVPVTLPFLWLLFMFRRGYNMFDHAVFSFYSLSAMAVLMICVSVLGVLDLGGAAATLMLVAPPVHMFMQLRGTYALSRLGAFWRTLALLIYAGLALLAYFLFVVVVSM